MISLSLILASHDHMAHPKTSIKQVALDQSLPNEVEPAASPNIRQDNMRFRNFNFAEMKGMSPCVCLAIAALIVCLYPLMANAQARQIKSYAVQIAALSSQQSADELVKGL